MNKFNKGFTLIEILIVVSIIFILALLVMSNYSSYTKKSIVASGMSLARGIVVSDIYTMFITGNSCTGLDKGIKKTINIDSKYIKEISYSSSGALSVGGGDCIINIDYQPDFFPEVEKPRVVLRVQMMDAHTIDHNNKPINVENYNLFIVKCESESTPAEGFAYATIPNKYLPIKCSSGFGTAD